MSDKLVKELKKVKTRELKRIDGDDILNDAKTLLIEAQEKDHRILGQLGLDHQVKYTDKLQRDVQRSNIAEKLYARDSYTGEQIKRLCIKYNLRILRSSKYNGSIPTDLVRKVDEFIAKNDIVIKSNSFWILAPTNQFKKIKHVPVAVDPILFYLADAENMSTTNKDSIEEDDILLNVHNWGNDFTFKRKFAWLWDESTVRSNTSLLDKMTLLGLVTIIFMLCNYFIAHEIIKSVLNIVFLVFLGIQGIRIMVTKGNEVDRNWNINLK